MFRGNPAHTGVYESRAEVQFNRVKWKFHTGGPVISSPAIASGTIYFGSGDGTFYALDAQSGKLRWKFVVNSRVSSSPAISDGMVYFGAYDGYFYALAASTGTLRWKYQTGGEHRFEAKHLHGSQPAAEIMPDPFDCYLSSPVVWNGFVYFGSGDGNVYSLSATSGSLHWKFHAADVVHASPAIADGTLFIGSWDSYFYALNASTGEVKWKFKTGEDPDTHNQVGIQSSAVVADGIVYFGCRDSHLYALDAATGEKKWALPTNGSWVVASPAVKDGRVYVPTSDSSLLFTLDAKSGKVLATLGFNQWYLFSSPAIAGKVLYVGSTEGKLFAVDLATFKPLWDFPTEGFKKHASEYVKPDGSPDVNLIYRSDFYDDMVSGVDRILSRGAILSSPVIDDRSVYFGSADGNVYALI